MQDAYKSNKVFVAIITSAAVLALAFFFTTQTAAVNPLHVEDGETAYLPLVSHVNMADACKLPEAGSHGGVGLGIPPYPARLKSLGTVRAKIIFVDFSDAPATRTTQEIFNILSPTATDYFSAVSYGKMSYQLEPHFEWYRMSKPSTEYQWDNLTFFAHRDYIQEAADLADADVDFAGVDQIVVMATPNASALFNGPALVPNPGQGITVDGVTIDNAVTSGADLLFWGGFWLNHETGHNLGLIDLYAFFGSPSFRFTGNFDLMGNIGGFAPELMAYNRFMLGWVEDDEISCQLTNDETVTLTAIEQPGGIKAVMVPTGPTSLVVVESRRAIGYDTALPKEGALVYMVDSSISTGMGGFKCILITMS